MTFERWELSFRQLISILIRVLEKIRRIKRLWFSNGRLDERRATRHLFSAAASSASEMYTRGQCSDLTLNRLELEQFKKKGWVGAYPLLVPQGVELAVKVHNRIRGRFNSQPTDPMGPPGSGVARPWSKSLHAYVPEFYDMAGHPAIVERVASILGPDIIVWGFSINAYFPGKIHPWHIDVEHLRWKGVSVFLGLKNITIQSTLKVISGSQRMGRSPLEIEAQDDESALAACLKSEKEAELVPVPVGEGEFFIFDGPIWHGSRNSSRRTRYAAIIQYCAPDQKVQAPMGYGSPVQWHPYQPPCILVKGKDRWGINRVVERP